MGIVSSQSFTHLYKNTHTEKNQSNPIQYFGLKNFGNICYCNSVLQSLYHFHPFRLQCMLHRDSDDSLLHTLGELFWELKPDNSQRGPVDPKKFIQKLQTLNVMYSGSEHHDAHEFFIFLLNTLVEDIQANSTHLKMGLKDENFIMSLDEYFKNDIENFEKQKNDTWIHQIFQGLLVYETRCLCCENISYRRENFFDLSVDIIEGSSLNMCIKKASDKELLHGTEKYFCTKCACHQEAIRYMKILNIPKLLTIHLKRFKYYDTDFGGRYKRLPYRVLLPLEIRIKCMDENNPFPLYQLLAVVVHIGVSMSRGHYISCIKTDAGWLLFDDQIVEIMSDENLQKFFGGLGSTCGVKNGYLLFYQHIQENTPSY